MFLAEGPAVGRPSEEGGTPIVALWRFTTEKRLTEEMLSGLSAYDVSLNGEKLFYARHDSWVIGDEPYVSIHFMGASDYARSHSD